MTRIVGFLVAVLCLVASTPAFAQNLRVIPVPWNQLDPSVPHPAYNGHPTTLKAIARGGNGTYTVEWDFEGDGTFDVSFVATNRYDLSTTFTYPMQPTRVTFDAVVRVTSNGQTITAVYPVRIFPDVPSDPTFATDRQLQVMRDVAIDDALWWMHTNMAGRTGNEEDLLTGSQVTGYENHPSATSTFYGRPQATSSFLWALGMNGHYVGFAPGTYLGTFPAGHAAVNALRWSEDPYAEDALRCLNYLLVNATIVSVPAADESNNYGVYPEVVRTPIPGTDDGIGIYIGAFASDQTTNPMGDALAALSVSHLTGLTAQTGDANRILGKPLEFVVQQMVDALTWSQNDSCSVVGSWYYSPNACAFDIWETLSAITGLWVADEHMSSSGVIVNNQAKLRIASFLVSNANAPSGTEYCQRYFVGAGCDFGATSMAALYGGWLGIDKYDPADTRIAFPGYLGFTRGQLRTYYDRYQNFLGNNWRTWQENTDIGWSGGLWELDAGGLADFERTDHLGNGWSMFHLANAARAHQPDLLLYGTQDWARQFAIYDIQNQFADGHTQSDWPMNYWESTGAKWMSTGWTTLTLTGDGIPPYTIATASALTAPEGSPITFDAGQSDPGTGPAAPSWVWDFGNGQTSTQPVAVYAYPDNGTFNVTLTGGSGGSDTDTIAVTITNVAPSVTVAAATTAPEGTAMSFLADVFDPGVADTHTLLWDFGDGANSALDAPSHAFADNGNFMVMATATDDDGGSGSGTANVTITNVAPSITSTPPLTANDGAEYVYALTSFDPGTADTHVCSLPTKPAGMTLNGCTASWSPTWASLAGASSANVEICVTDDDLAKTCQAYSIAVSLADADADGLPDGWEIAWFGSITAQNGAGDPDQDGRTNAQEYAAGQNPTVFGGPSAPVLVSPANGTIANAPSLALVVLDAVDPDGDVLTWEFQLATDAAFTTLVDSTSASLVTVWTPSAALTENARYCWRARASDGAAQSPWSAPACFLRSATNDAPGTPVPLSPAAGGRATSKRPLLSWLEAADPEADAVFYEVELAATADFTAPLASAMGIPGGNAVLDVDLAADGTQYFWRVRGIDGNGAAGPWSSAADFVVDLSSGSSSSRGCGCSLTTERNSPSVAPALLALAAVSFTMRRRRTARG